MGEFLGQLIIIFYILTILKFVFKRIENISSKYLLKNEILLGYYEKIVLYLIKYHRLFGVITVILIIFHFIVQMINEGLSITGLIAAFIMLFQVLLGMYGVKFKNKWKYWLTMHRIIALIILIAILIHTA